MDVQEQIRAIRQAANGYKLSRVLITAEELGVFEAVEDAPADIRTIAARLGVPPARLESLLNVLVGQGILELAKGKYCISENFCTLRPSHPASQNGYLHYAAAVAERWTGLKAAVHSSEFASGNFSDITGRDGEAALAFAQAMDANAKTQAQYLAGHYEFTGSRILDIGAGAGTYSVTVGKKYGNSSGVLLELPSMVPITKRFIEMAGVAERFEVVAGDYHESLPGDGYDDVLLCAVVHQEPEAGLRQLLALIRSVLRPQGRLFLSSFFLDSSRVSPAFSAMFAVEMLVMVPSGRVYTFEEMESLLDDCGFRSQNRITEMPGSAGWYVAS